MPPRRDEQFAYVSVGSIVKKTDNPALAGQELTGR